MYWSYLSSRELDSRRELVNSLQLLYLGYPSVHSKVTEHSADPSQWLKQRWVPIYTQVKLLWVSNLSSGSLHYPDQKGYRVSLQSKIPSTQFSLLAPLKCGRSEPRPESCFFAPSFVALPSLSHLHILSFLAECFWGTIRDTELSSLFSWKWKFQKH